MVLVRSLRRAAVHDCSPFPGPDEHIERIRITVSDRWRRCSAASRLRSVRCCRGIIPGWAENPARTRDVRLPVECDLADGSNVSVLVRSQTNCAESQVERYSAVRAKSCLWFHFRRCAAAERRAAVGLRTLPTRSVSGVSLGLTDRWTRIPVSNGNLAGRPPLADRFADSPSRG